MLPHETPQQFADRDAVWRVLGEFVDTSALEHCRTAVYRFHALVVERWRHGRVFLMGDAAHQMPPFLGQGMCAGVRDAFNLAWKLDAVMRGQASPGLLDTYTDERERHVRTVVGHAREFGLIDRDEEGKPTPGAGELLVQPWVRQEGGPWQRLACFLIAAISPQVLEVVDNSVRARWAALDGRWMALGSLGAGAAGDALLLKERDGLLAGWLRERGAVALVARPDRYVYGIAQSGDALQRLVPALCGTMAEIGTVTCGGVSGNPLYAGGESPAPARATVP